jgi:hypothetical protein
MNITTRLSQSRVHFRTWLEVDSIEKIMYFRMKRPYGSCVLAMQRVAISPPQ